MLRGPDDPRRRHARPIPDELPASSEKAIAQGYQTHPRTSPCCEKGSRSACIILRRTEVQLFTERQVALLETFADQAVIAIENVRLFQELEARTRDLTQSVGELQALGEVSQAVGSTLDLETVLATIVSRAVQLSGSDQGLVYEFDEATQTFEQRATHQIDAGIRGSASGGAHQTWRGSDGSGRGDPGARRGG